MKTGATLISISFMPVFMELIILAFAEIGFLIRSLEEVCSGIPFKEIFPLFPAIAKSHPDGGEFDAYIGSEYALQSGCFNWIPFISLQYMYLHMDQYKENGGNLYDLEIDSQKADSLRSTLGMRLNNTWQVRKGTVFLEGVLGWQREYLDNSRSIQFQPIYFNQATGSIPVLQSGRDILIGSFDFLITWSQNFSFEAYYSFDWSKTYQTNSFYLSWDFNF